jgi:hypothetical protein
MEIKRLGSKPSGKGPTDGLQGQFHIDSNHVSK